MKVLFSTLIILFLFLSNSSFANESNNNSKKYAVNKSKNKLKFKCDARQHCSQMKNYEEAKYFINHCPNTKMDGDKDGIPCEGYTKK